MANVTLVEITPARVVLAVDGGGRKPLRLDVPVVCAGCRLVTDALGDGTADGETLTEAAMCLYDFLTNCKGACCPTACIDAMTPARTAAVHALLYHVRELMKGEPAITLAGLVPNAVTVIDEIISRVRLAPVNTINVEREIKAAVEDMMAGTASIHETVCRKQRAQARNAAVERARTTAVEALLKARVALDGLEKVANDIGKR